MKIEEYLKLMVEKGASDLYFKTGSPPYLRIDDKLLPVSDKKTETVDIESIIDAILLDEQKESFRIIKELDGAYSLPGIGRFRFNIYNQRNTPAITFRSIKIVIPSFAELNLPLEVMEKISSLPRGLVLITGHAGSGKSTTLAAMINYINQNFQKHIITIEDPIEFVFSDIKSIISQREVGSDTVSFNNALRHVIRQSPDVIFIGEMRDTETMQIAIMAAETGHLVLSTLHTVDATQTVDRIINFFPSEVQGQIRMQLSFLLKAVISQRLIPRCDKPGRMPACEIMFSTPTVRKLIAEGKTGQLISVIEEGQLFGMQSFNQALVGLLKKSVISKGIAMSYASNPDELNLRLSEILQSRDNII
jgi:twitching motility protein PilT